MTPENPPAPVGLCEIRGLELRDAAPDPETGAERFEFVGHAAVFDSLSENLGGFRERIMRGAFRNVLDQDVRLLVNHDPNLPLARGDALQLTEDPTGLHVRAQIRSDLSYARDLRINLEEGNVTQMSFAFGSDVEDEWNAIVALRSDNSPTPESTEREDVADAAEPVLEADDSEQRAEVDEADDGAGLTTEAVRRRLAILALRARS